MLRVTDKHCITWKNVNSKVGRHWVLVMLCEFVSLNTCPTYIAHSLTLMPRATCSHLHLHIAIHATSIETLLQPSHGMQTTFLEGDLDMTAHNDRCQAQKSPYFSYCTPYIRESNQQRTYKPIHQPARTWHVSIRPFSYTNMLWVLLSMLHQVSE